MSFELPSLPYEMDALSPHISKETLEYHYGKHHNAYVTKLNDAIKDSEYANDSLEDIVRKSKGGLFNNAAQTWNHTFYWKCLSPNGGGEATGEIADKIKSKWGSFDKFKDDFTSQATGLFGSGWAFLVKDGDSVSIEQYSNAGCPVADNKTALLTCDVWEHAYYVDYRNARPKYVEAFWNLVNWDFVNKNLQS